MELINTCLVGTFNFQTIDHLTTIYKAYQPPINCVNYLPQYVKSTTLLCEKIEHSRVRCAKMLNINLNQQWSIKNHTSFCQLYVCYV